MEVFKKMQNLEQTKQGHVTCSIDNIKYNITFEYLAGNGMSTSVYTFAQDVIVDITKTEGKHTIGDDTVIVNPQGEYMQKLGVDTEIVLNKNIVWKLEPLLTTYEGSDNKDIEITGYNYTTDTDC